FFYKKGFIDLAREAYGKHGVYYLGPQLSPRWDIMSKKPITSMQDFKGLKIRSFGLEAKWYENMGATPVFMSGGEVYTALATGVIDAARWASPAGNFNHASHGRAKYSFQRARLHVPKNSFAVTQRAWDGRPAAKEPIRNGAAIASSFDYLALREMKAAPAMQAMEQSGVQVAQIPDEERAKME